MNDAFRELASQCWDQHLDGLHFDQVMFAQLIVKKCIEICNNGTATQTTSAGAAEQIKLHFGIEE